MSWSNFLLIASGLQWTLVLTVGSFIFGALLAAPLCWMRVSRSPLLNAVAISVIVVLRSIPPVVWLFLLYFGLGSGIVKIGSVEAAIIALGLITAANLAEIYRGGLKSIHRGQFDAAQALALARWSEFVDVVAPQLFRVTLPSSVTYFIGLLKDSAIASTIGVTEVAYFSNFVARREFDSLSVFALAAALYILVSLPVAAFARYTDARLRRKVAR